MHEHSAESTPLTKRALADDLHSGRQSALQRYRTKAAGPVSPGGFILYELAMLVSNLGGGVGYVVRKTLFSRLLAASGSGLIVGKGVVLRHPGNILLGHRVAIDDYCLIDAAGAGPDGVTIGDDVIVSRNCIVQGKVGPVAIGARSDIGPNTVITASSGVTLGESVLIAANCYIGGARYHIADRNRPILNQGIYTRGPVSIGAGTWLGAGVIVLDGVTIGAGCVVGAGSVVTKSLPEYSIAHGVPAAVQGRRP